MGNGLRRRIRTSDILNPNQELYQTELCADSMMIESKIEKKFRKHVELHGGKSFKFVSPGITGVPDQLVIMPPNRFALFEIKAIGGAPSPMQKYIHRELAKLGVTVYVPYTIEEAIDMFNEVFHSENST